MIGTRCYCIQVVFALVLFCWNLPVPIHGQERTNIASAYNSSANEVLSSLQAMQLQHGDVFVVQNELDPLIESSGGGACPSAACVIAMQALRCMAGSERHPLPHKVALEAFRNQPKLLDGRVSNKQFVDLILFYEKYVSNAKLSIRVQSAPNSPYAADANVWASDGNPDLKVLSDELKILSFSVTEPNGNFLGRHFVLLKRIDGDQMFVVDPTSPNKEKQFTLEAGLPGCGRFFLRYPAEFQRPYVNELNTIFTIRLERNKFATVPLSMANVLQRIDETAHEMKKKGLLRSPRDWRKQTVDFGLPALDLPGDVGGYGWSAEQMLEVFRHAGRHDLNLRDVVGGAHGRILVNSKSPQAADLLRGVVRGERYFAITITEPNYGSDFTSMESTSRNVDGGYILNGEKRFNARLEQATDVIVITKSPENKRGKLNVFVLPIDAKGLTIESFGAHGLTGNSYGGLTMKDVFVPESSLIGEDGKGYDLFSKHFLYWRLMQTATAIGTAEGALVQMAERLKTRIVFGGPIGRFTHLQQPMGQHTTELKMAHSLAIRAAKLLDEGKYSEAEPLINGLKAEGVEIALMAVDAAARAFGGEGFSELVDIGDRLRDLNGLRIADGATDVMRSAVVRDEFGREFWDMATKGSFNRAGQESEPPEAPGDQGK